MNSFLATRATVVCASDPLGADELAHACGADLAWVVQLVEVGHRRCTGRRRRPTDGTSTVPTCSGRWRHAGSSAISRSGWTRRR